MGKPRPAGRRQIRVRRQSSHPVRPRLSTYLAALVGLSAVVAAAAVGLVRVQADHSAYRNAAEEAKAAADAASVAITQAVSSMQAAVDGLAANPSLAELVTHPAACDLQYSPTNLFPTGHIDILGPNKASVCTSLGDTYSAGQLEYASAPWVAKAEAAPAVLGPERDPNGGQPALVIAAPFSSGLVTIVVDLRRLGPSLANELGGTDRVVFLLSDRSGIVLARSLAPQRWIGKQVTEGVFSRSAQTSDHPDLDGTPRIYAGRILSPLGWHLYAGVNRATALAAANSLFYRELAIILAGLSLIVAATFFVHRRIARPIRLLSKSVRSAQPGVLLPVVSPAGPAEVAELADGFRGLFLDVERELQSRRAAEASARAAAQSAAESERLYRLLFESNPLPMWIHDTVTRTFIEVNRAAQDQYGFSQEQFVAMKVDDIFPPSEPSVVPEIVGQAGEVNRTLPSKHLRSDGTEIDVEVTSSRVEFGGRQARFVMAANVTEREQVRRRLIRSERLESLGQLAGSVAHDFNNLLAVMLNYSAFVKEELDRASADDPERWVPVRDDFGQVVKAVDEATGVTRQLLAFGRRERISPQPLDLNRVLAEHENLLRRSVGVNVTLVTDAEPGLWPVIADPSQIGQILVNLAVNARDAMPRGGQLTIGTSNVEVDEGYRSLRPGMQLGRYVRLKVADTGTGMEQSVVQRAFEPFFTTKAASKGTGLGLATVYGVVTQAGGDVQIYSEPGHGTTVSVLLRAADTSVPPPTEKLSVAVGSFTGETVLVVEDDEPIRQLICRILSLNGYQVVGAADGPTAIKMASRHGGRIDLLLTDMTMPAMLGIEVAERIGELIPEIRVLFMSGNAPLGSNMLDKPFSERVLLTKVREILDRPKASYSP